MLGRGSLAALYCEILPWWLSSESWVIGLIRLIGLGGLALSAKLFRRHFPLSMGAVGAVLIGIFVRQVVV